MSHADFVHLRVHTAYSLSEGAIRIPDLVDMCVRMRMPAVAICDTNNLFGAMDFSKACSESGIQPIVGCQLSVVGDQGGKNPTAEQRTSSTRPTGIVLLAQNRTGYLNLLKLISHAYLDDDEYAGEPSVSVDDLEAHSDGLILLSGGVEGPIGRLLTEGQKEAAESLLLRLAAAYKGRIYVEIMRHGTAAEKAIEPALIELAYKHDLPLVATNEAFFTDQGMFEAHDALICIAEGTYVSQDERRHLSRQHYFKSAEQMRTLFADIPEALDNTLIVAKRCAFMVEKIDPILPPYNCGDGRREEDALRAMALDGLDMRLTSQVYSGDMSAEDREKAACPYRERLEYELDVIVNMKYPGYFLIVADFIRWAKENGVSVGPGRGSGAGSVVAWALTITDIDPLRFGLLFERFLNPERISMPDFDIDFCQENRDKVIRYVQKKYGRDRVAQIITFGKLQARAVLRDVGRVQEMPYGQVDRICKLVPNNPADPVTLDKAFSIEPQLRQMAKEDRTVARLIEIARKLEGLYRHASTHAAGVVIGDRPLDELIPLYRDPRSDMPVSGFNMKYVEQAGLVKFDFLGLKTLTVLSRAVELAADEGTSIDLSNLPLDDETTFKMLGRGETTGVFQLESEGMTKVLTELEPSRFEDIIAVVALYRPGPMENIPSYIERKHGRETPDYLYPTLEGILRETFGIMIYQEQVMQIAQELSGYTLGAADILRRAMGKKIKKEMNQQRKIFVDGAEARGVPKGKASDIFDQVARFADYGFNKSHAAAYAMVAYQTAYMKANHTVEFLTASMILDIHNTDKLEGFKKELKDRSITLFPPDINASGAVFTVEHDKRHKVKGIRYGLAAIKNVGEAAMEMVIKERNQGGPFVDIFDFASRIDSKALNKRQIENLARAGAFDSINPNRKQIFDGVETLVRHASICTSERHSNQIGLFGDAVAPISGTALLDTGDWTKTEKLNEEFNAFGFYPNEHPLDAYEALWKQLKVKKYGDVLRQGNSGQVCLAGLVRDLTIRTSNKGNRYAIVGLSDASGNYKITLFSEILNNCRDIIETGNLLFIKASAQFEGELRLNTLSIKPLDSVCRLSAMGLKLYLDTPESLPGLSKALSTDDAAGNGKVTIISRIQGNNLAKDEIEVEIELPDGYSISPATLMAIREISGISIIEDG